MKLLTVLVLVACGWAKADSTRPVPILGRVIGGVAETGEQEPGLSKRCFVYPNQIINMTFNLTTGQNQSFTTPVSLTSQDVRQIDAYVAAAAKAREGAAAHVRETVPHVYYFAYGTGKDRVRLYFDGPRMIRREGNDAATLMQLIENFCPHR